MDDFTLLKTLENTPTLKGFPLYSSVEESKKMDVKLGMKAGADD
ncbi:MAG: hypothetical protein ACJAU2_001931 [Maribacter sp.]|jgi:hypothetical protein